MLKLKEYMRINFQNLEIICRDPMLLIIRPAYKVDDFKKPNFTLLESFTEITDPKGYQAKIMINDINIDRALVNKRRMRHMDDRELAYRLIRTMCSATLNAILTVKVEFIDVEFDDPLKLLEVIKSVVTSRCDGSQEFERSQALRDWYTLTMSTGEDIVPYGRRAVKLFDRFAATGVPEAQIPNAVQLASTVTCFSTVVAIFTEVALLCIFSKCHFRLFDLCWIDLRGFVSSRWFFALWETTWLSEILSLIAMRYPSPHGGILLLR